MFLQASNGSFQKSFDSVQFCRAIIIFKHFYLVLCIYMSQVKIKFRFKFFNLGKWLILNFLYL